MSVYDLGDGLRLVDLTKVPDPATKSGRCHLIRYSTSGPTLDFHTALDPITHLGTHCECPYHHFEDGKSVGELPLITSMGYAIHVNIDFLEPNSRINAIDLDCACSDHTKEGDIMILDGNWEFPPFIPAIDSPDDKRLFINAENIWWLRNHRVKCVNFGDGIPIRSYNEDVKPFHDILVEVDTVFLGVLKSLEDLTTDTFSMPYTPLPLIGAGSMPVCTYAIEGLPGSTV